MTESLREQIARIIDPSSWRVMDSYLAGVKRRKNARYDPEAFKDKASLATADAILALIVPPDLREASELAAQGEFTTGCEYSGYQSLHANECELANDLWNADARLITLAVNRIRELLA